MASESLITPLFPLPDLVFYPHTLLPLHVFEPRYVQMTTDALSGPRLLAIVQLRPNWEHDYEGAPAIYEVATMGRIVHHERLESGRYNILLLGLERIHIVEELEREGLDYRRALVDVVQSRVPEERSSLDEARSRALAQCHRMMELRPVLRRWIEKVLGTYEKPEVFADVLAAFLAQNFPVGAYERQCILEEPDVARRLALISIQVQRVIGELIEGAY